MNFGEEALGATDLVTELKEPRSLVVGVRARAGDRHLDPLVTMEATETPVAANSDAERKSHCLVLLHPTRVWRHYEGGDQRHALEAAP